MSSGTTIAVDALNELVDTVLSGGSEDDSSETQLKLLTIIIKHGIQSKHRPKGVYFRKKTLNSLSLTLFRHKSNRMGWQMSLCY